jgi:hypothetical protein
MIQQNSYHFFLKRSRHPENNGGAAEKAWFSSRRALQ